MAKINLHTSQFAILLLTGISSLIMLMCILTLMLHSYVYATEASNKTENVTHNECIITWSAWSFCDPCSKMRHRRVNHSEPAYVSESDHSPNDKSPCPVDIDDIFESRKCNSTEMNELSQLSTEAIQKLYTLSPDDETRKKRSLFDKWQNEFKLHVQNSIPDPKVCLRDEQQVCGQQIDCGGGSCIDAVMKCNCDRDCSDGSDEKFCKRPYTTEEIIKMKKAKYKVNLSFPQDTSDWTKQSKMPKSYCPCGFNSDVWYAGTPPGITITGYGFSSIEGKLKNRPLLDQSAFGGVCNLVRYKNATFRLPYNTEAFTEVFDSRFETVRFESQGDYLKRTTSDKSNRLTVEAGINIIGLAKISIKFSKAERYRELTQTKSKEQEVRIDQRVFVKVAKFQNKKEHVYLHGAFITALLELGITEYNYWKMFEEFGTHYVESGFLGGIFSKSYRLNAKTLENIKETEENKQMCLGITVGATIKGVSVESTVKRCQQTSEELKTYSNDYTQKIKIAAVTVGGLRADVTLPQNKASDAEIEGTLNDWYQSVRESPEIIQLSVQPICNLLRHELRVRHLMDKCQHHLEEYLLYFDKTPCEAYCPENYQPLYNFGLCYCIPDNLPSWTKHFQGKNDRCRNLRKKVVELGGVCITRQGLFKVTNTQCKAKVEAENSLSDCQTCCESIGFEYKEDKCNIMNGDVDCIEVLESNENLTEHFDTVNYLGIVINHVTTYDQAQYFRSKAGARLMNYRQKYGMMLAHAIM